MKMQYLNAPWMTLEQWNHVVREVQDHGKDINLTVIMSYLYEQKITMAILVSLQNTGLQLVSTFRPNCSIARVFERLT